MHNQQMDVEMDHLGPGMIRMNDSDMVSLMYSRFQLLKTQMASNL
jgi:hypothetical protein